MSQENVEVVRAAIEATNRPVRLVRFGTSLCRLRRDDARVSLEPLNPTTLRYEIETKAKIRFFKSRGDLGKRERVGVRRESGDQDGRSQARVRASASWNSG